MAGYLIAIALLVIVGWVAISRINTIGTTVHDLADNLASDQYVAEQIVTQVLLTRFYANKFIRDHDAAYLPQFEAEFANLQTVLAQAETQITQPERAELLATIKTKAELYEETFLTINSLIAARDETIDDVLDVQGPLAQEKLAQLHRLAYEDDRLFIAYRTSQIGEKFEQMRLLAFKYLQEGEPQLIPQFNESYDELLTSLEMLDSQMDTSERRQLAAEARLSIEQYTQGFANIQSGYDQQNELIDEQLDVVGPEIRQDATEIAESVNADFEAANQATERLVTQTVELLGGVILVAVIVAVGLGVVLTRSVTKPLHQVTKMADLVANQDLPQLATEMTALSQGDLTRKLTLVSEVMDTKRTDELGQLCRAFNIIISRLQVVGTAFDEMTGSLNQLVREVLDNALLLSAASHQLSDTASQVSEATQQIATSAHEQNNSVSQANGAAVQISQAIRQIALSAEDGAEGASQAEKLATEGTALVNANIAGMTIIKSKVGRSAQRVQEMGERSAQISLILDTIQGIASQTNLLALNAAIEAARAEVKMIEVKISQGAKPGHG
ncbi:MAG: HAMP domain-containing protein, partial [Anaerolineae bacterium]|nr:HAMP domain-containing protein [Anaerolineae bacterium]